MVYSGLSQMNKEIERGFCRKKKTINVLVSLRVLLRTGCSGFSTQKAQNSWGLKTIFIAFTLVSLYF